MDVARALPVDARPLDIQPIPPVEAARRPDPRRDSQAVGVVVSLGNEPIPRAPQYLKDGRMRDEAGEAERASRVEASRRGDPEDPAARLGPSDRAAARRVESPGGIDGPTVVDGAVVAGKGDVIVDILSSTSSYANQIFWSTDNFRTRHVLPLEGEVTSVTLGSFPPGTAIEFGVEGPDGQLRRAAATQPPAGESGKGPGHVHRPGESVGEGA
jgi:hypothetical protein